MIIEYGIRACNTIRDQKHSYPDYIQRQLRNRAEGSSKATGVPKRRLIDRSLCAYFAIEDEILGLFGFTITFLVL